MHPILLSVIVFAGLAGVMGILIGISSKFLAVEEDTRVASVKSLLPGANCGGCGFAGCSGLADAIVNQGANPTRCKPAKEDAVRAIKKFLEEHQ